MTDRRIGGLKPDGQPVSLHIERGECHTPPEDGWYSFQCGHERSLQTVKVLEETELAWGYCAEPLMANARFRLLFTSGFPFDREDQRFEARLRVGQTLGKPLFDSADGLLVYDEAEIDRPTPRRIIEEMVEEIV